MRPIGRSLQEAARPTRREPDPRISALPQESQKFSPGALKIATSGLKFFYNHTVPRDWETLKKIRIPRARTLPDVLAVNEVRQLIDAVSKPYFRAFSGQSIRWACDFKRACICKSATSTQSGCLPAFRTSLGNFGVWSGCEVGTGLEVRLPCSYNICEPWFGKQGIELHRVSIPLHCRPGCERKSCMLGSKS